MTIEREPPRGAGPGTAGAEDRRIAAGKSSRAAKRGATAADAPPAANDAPGYSFYPPFESTGAGATDGGASGADDPFALHLNATPLGPATRLGSIAADVSEAAGLALAALQRGGFHDAQVIDLKDKLGTLGDALHEHAGDRSDGDERSLRRALRDARAVANELTRRHSGRRAQDDLLWKRIELIERLAANRTEVVETPHMPQVLAEHVNESFAQLTSVRNTLAKFSDVLPEVDLAALDEAIVTTAAWQDTVTNPRTSRTQLLRISKAIVDQHEVLPKAFQGLELILREPLTASSGKVVAAYVHAMALSTKRRTLAEVALDRARKLRKQAPLDVAAEALEGDDEIVTRLGALDREQGRQAKRENRRLEHRKHRIEQRLEAGQHVSRTEIDELNVEAREASFKHHLALLATNASQLASALDRMDDGVVGWLAKPDGVTIPRLVDDLRGLGRVTAAAMAGYRERVDLAKEEVERGDTGDRRRVAQAKAEALDWAERFVREWLETGYYDERIKRTEAVMADVQTRTMLANFAIILATMLVGNFAGSLAARGVTAARGAAVATEVTMGTEAMATAAAVVADATVSAGLQKLATDDPTSFGTLLATNLAVPLAVAPISRHFRGLDDVYKSGARATTLWQKAGRAGSWGLRRGAELNMEMVAGAAADYLVRRAASAGGPPPNEQTQEEWLLQGASIAVGRFVHGAAGRIGEHYSQRKARNAEMAQRSRTVAELGKLAENEADVRSAVEALGEYKRLLDADQDALVAELEITHEANPAHGDLMKRLAQNQREQGQLDQLGLENLAMRGAGLRPKNDGGGDESWEGDATQIQETLVLARSLGIEHVRARYDERQRRWAVEIGARKVDVADTGASGDVPAHARTTEPMNAVDPDAIPTALPDDPTAKMRRPDSDAAATGATRRPYERARVPDDVEAAIAKPENALELINRTTGVDKAGFSDRVDNIVKGPAYDEAMSQLREFYTQMQGEAQHVTKNAGRVADGPYRWGYANDAQSFSHGLSNVEFRVHLAPQPGVSDADLARVKARVHRGVDQYYNFKHAVRGADGVERRLHVEVVFVDDAANAHLMVHLHPGDGVARPSHWFVGGTETTDAHEIGHGSFGLKDEYADKYGLPPGRESEASPGVKHDDSLMGNYWLDRITNRVKPGTGLRDRHRDEIGRQMPDPRSSKDDSTTEGPDGSRIEGPGAPGGMLESLVSGAMRGAAVREIDAIPVSVMRTPDNGSGTVYLARDADLARLESLLRVLEPEIRVETFPQGLVVRADGAEWFVERGSDSDTTAGARAERVAGHVGARFGLPPPNAFTVKFYGFRGVRRVKSIRLDQLVGKDKQAVDLIIKNEPLLYYGHVGISLDGGKTIYGFTPDRTSRPDLSDEEFIAHVKSNAMLPGLARDDTHVFRLAEKLAREDGWELVINELTQIQDETMKRRVAEQIVEMTANDGRGADAGHGKLYQFPREHPNERGSHFDKECAANCAVYPKFLGLPLPEESGLMSQYIPALKRLAVDGVVDARSKPRWKR